MLITDETPNPRDSEPVVFAGWHLRPCGHETSDHLAGVALFAVGRYSLAAEFHYDRTTDSLTVTPTGGDAQSLYGANVLPTAEVAACLRRQLTGSPS